MRYPLYALLVISSCLCAADEAPSLEFVPPGSRAIIGIDLRSLIDSPLVRDLGRDILPGAASKWSISSQVPGVDPRKDIDQVVAVSTLEGAQPPWLIILRGRFHAAEIRNGARLYHGVPVISMQDGSGLAWIDSGTMLAGDLKEVRAAIDRPSAKTARPNPALASRIGQLRGRYAVWGAGTVPNTYRPPAGAPDGLRSLDQFDFGIGLTQGLEIFASLHVRDAADLKNLGSAIELIRTMSQAQPDSSLNNMEVRLENNSLRFSLLVPAETLRRTIVEQRANLAKFAAQTVSGNVGFAMPANPGGLAAATAVSAPSATPVSPPKTLRDEKGNTLVVTLPGKQ